MKQKNQIAKTLSCLIVGFSLFAFGLPHGWHKAGSNPDDYAMGVTDKEKHDGNKVAFITSTNPKAKGFGTLMQSFSAEKYIGKKIRMSAYAKSAQIKDWAGFWLRLDGQNRNETLGFDNMQNRPIKGSTDWVKYETEMDIPEGTASIAYGCLLSGTGSIWFDDFSFEIIGEAGQHIKPVYTDKPTNTGFEE